MPRLKQQAPSSFTTEREVWADFRPAHGVTVTEAPTRFRCLSSQLAGVHSRGAAAAQAPASASPQHPHAVADAKPPSTLGIQSKCTSVVYKQPSGLGLLLSCSNHPEEPRFHDGSNPPSRASQAVTPAPPPAGRPLPLPQPCLDRLQDSWLRCYFVQKLFLMPPPSPSWAGTTVVCSVAPCPPLTPQAQHLKHHKKHLPDGVRTSL